jgi:hypothetical protein
MQRLAVTGANLRRCRAILALPRRALLNCSIGIHEAALQAEVGKLPSGGRGRVARRPFVEARTKLVCSACGSTDILTYPLSWRLMRQQGMTWPG